MTVLCINQPYWVKKKDDKRSVGPQWGEYCEVYTIWYVGNMIYYGLKNYPRQDAFESSQFILCSELDEVEILKQRSCAAS